MDDGNAGDWQMGAASRWWLHQSLRSLNALLGGHLRYFRDDATRILARLARDLGVAGVYWNRCCEPWRIDRDSRIKAELTENGISVESFNGSLVDADLANNSAGWQWIAGCGADAAPYFRIFNPVTQGQKFDPDGDYVRRFVPEFARLPDKFLHSPWQAPAAVLAEASIALGSDYPNPMVDLKASRERVLEVFRSIGEPAVAS